jgi:hypothetical protein
MAEAVDGVTRYTFEMTAERARAAEREIDAALWVQNERLYHHIRARMPWRGKLRVVALVLCVLGLVLAVPSAILAPIRRLEFSAAVVAFALLFVVFRYLEPLERAIRRGTRKLVANRARRSMASVIRRTPYTIDYALEDGRLTISAKKLGVVADVPLKRARLAVVGRSVICLFDRPIGQRPLRVLYVPSEHERLLLENALAASGAQLMAIEERATEGSSETQNGAGPTDSI